MFDIVHDNALNVTLDEEVRKHLESPREKGRRDYIGSIEIETTKNEHKNLENRRRDTTNEVELKKREFVSFSAYWQLK